MNQRASGILLHITSLPSSYGIGDLGPSAYRFIDFLVECGHTIWQILPLNPTGTYLGNSPYTSYSAFAGNPLLISLDVLVQQGLLSESELGKKPLFPQDRVDYPGAIAYKGAILRSLYTKKKSELNSDADFLKFCQENTGWLEDYSLFVALKDRFEEVSWQEWPDQFRDRNEQALSQAGDQFAERILRAKFYQYLFFSQLSSLKDYCNARNIRIMGDLPIYTSIDSADVWAHPEMYHLDDQKKPVFVAGAPPDYFSATGQRWGNPVYRWEVLQQTKYAWWIDRLKHTWKLFDVVRLDHFRGFVAYWEIPADEDTAVHGRWVEAPAIDFFTTVLQELPGLPIIVEDLGFITPDVKQVMEHFSFPGMKVLLFAFGPDLPTNPYAPHNFMRNCVVYTGTHDNNTIHGWFDSEATKEEKERVLEYLGKTGIEENIHWELIRLAMSSVAGTAIIPMQDLLGLGEEARMNHPSRSQGNWTWRFTQEQLTPELQERLLKMTRMYGRMNQPVG